MSTLDQTDRQILVQLEKDATKSSAALAKILSISPATVRRRIGRLLKDGVIRITATVDAGKVGFYLISLITLNVDPAKINKAIINLRAQKNVRWVAVSSGRYNIVIMARFSSTEELHLFIQDELSKLDGLETSETFICLRIEKGRYM
jgi:Lrp/AsnC family transcriptional regulator for asnA, asnC and gidA